MFCDPKALLTESDVEQKLVFPMLTSAAPRGLSYGEEELRTKHSIRRFEIDKGTSKKLYYPDYIAVLSGLPALVVEVKSPTEDVEEGLREARLYAVELNALYPHGVNPCIRVIATNGRRLLSAPVDTAVPDVDFTADHFSELDPAYADFSQKAEKKAILEHIHEVLQRQRRSEYFRALNLLGGSATQDEEVSHNTFGADIASRYRHLFNPTTRNDRRFIAKNAYVPSQRRHQYVEPIDRIIRAAVPPSISSSRPLENTASPSPVVNALKRASTLEHEVMLLVGGVGSGKSTFVDYLQEVALSPDVRAATEWVHVSMNEAPLDPNLIYDWLLDAIIKGLQEQHADLDFDQLPAWQGVFAAELNRFRNTVLALLPQNSPSRDERLADEMQRLMADRKATANAMIRYFCVEREKALILVLDNCDKRKLEEQLLMFQVAQWAKDALRCVVFLPIRDVTYDLYRNRPPLDTALKDLVFRIEPPMFSKVLAQRIRLALEEMSFEEGPKKLRFQLKSGVEVEYPASDRAMYLVSIAKSMFDYDRIVRRLITALAGRDVRKAMELFLEFCTSGHISENDIWRIKEAEGRHTLDYAVVVRVLLRMNRRFYDGEKAYVDNLVQCDPRDSYPDHFVRIAILRWLQVKFSLLGPTNVMGYHHCRMLISNLIAHGHDADRIRRELQYLVRKGCIVTEHQDKDRVSDDDLIAISPSGWVHVDLLGNADYLAACAEDIWFSELDRAQRVATRIGKKGEYGHYLRSTVNANAKEVVDYLEEQLKAWYRDPDKFLQDESNGYLHSLEPMLRAVKAVDVEEDIAPVIDAFGAPLKVGAELSGRITSVTDFGVFVRVVNNHDGLLHISHIPKQPDGSRKLPERGEMLRVKILRLLPERRRIELGLATPEKKEG